MLYEGLVLPVLLIFGVLLIAGWFAWRHHAGADQKDRKKNQGHRGALEHSGGTGGSPQGSASAVLGQRTLVMNTPSRRAAAGPSRPELRSSGEELAQAQGEVEAACQGTMDAQPQEEQTDSPEAFDNAPVCSQGTGRRQEEEAEPEQLSGANPQQAPERGELEGNPVVTVQPPRPAEGTLDANHQEGSPRMSVPLIKSEVVKGEAVRQILSESTIGLRQPAVKIKEIVASIRNVTAEVVEGKVIVQGEIHKQIFFVGTDNVVHHQQEDVPFSTFVDIPGAAPGMNIMVTPTVAHVVFHLIDEETLRQKVVADIFVKVTKTEILCIKTGEGPLVKVEELVCAAKGQMLEETDVTLDVPARKVTEMVADVRDLTFEPINDKVIIQGVIHKQIFFVGEDELEHHQAVNIPFSYFVDAPNTDSMANVQVVPQIVHEGFELRFDPGQEFSTDLHEKIIVDFLVEVTQTRQLTVEELEEGGVLILADVVDGESTSQMLVESEVELEREAIKIRQIDASVRELEATVINNKVILQGTIHKQIFYIGTDDVEYHQAEEVPFSHMVEVEGADAGHDAFVLPTVTHVAFELQTPTTLLQKVIVDFCVKVTRPEQIKVEAKKKDKVEC